MVMAQGLGHRAGFLWTDVRLGYVVLREGNLVEGRQQIQPEVTLNFQKDQNPGGVAFTLEGIASLHVTLGNANLAARLIGWADATREKIHEHARFLSRRM